MFMYKMNYFENMATWINNRAFLHRNEKKYRYETDVKHLIRYKYRRITGKHVMFLTLILIYMSTCPKIKMRKHWNKDHGTPFIKGLVALKPFERYWNLFTSYDCFGNYNDIIEIEKDNSFKARFLLGDLNRTSQYFMHWAQKLALDEIIVELFNRTVLRKHIKGKPHPDGIPLYGLANQDGYIYLSIMKCENFKNVMNQFTDIVKEERPRIVLAMLHLAKLFGKVGLQLYTDNYYGNIKVAFYLGLQGIYWYSTLNRSAVNRPKNSDKLNGELLQHGETRLFKGSYNPKSNVKKFDYLVNNPNSVYFRATCDSGIFFLCQTTQLGLQTLWHHQRSSIETKSRQINDNKH